MNRDIKFRAWDGTNMNYDFIVARPQFCNLLSILTDEKFAIENYNSIKEWKVMQLTELHDVDGKEIWEGDILQGYTTNDSIEFREVVKFNPALGYYITNKDIEDDRILYDNCIRFSDCKIIGNIYENPELLKNG